MITKHRIAELSSQTLFSIVTPLTIIPYLNRLKLTRLLVLFCFGKLYRNNYNKIIDTFKDKYGNPLQESLEKINDLRKTKINTILDCGSGTGFASSCAASYFSEARVISLDLLHNMLLQGKKFSRKDYKIYQVRGDNFSLPIRNKSVDLAIAQNTIPNFAELARICKPDGIIVYIDTSAAWSANIVKQILKKKYAFKKIICKKVDLGFFALIFL